jgi:hypothetical protein
MEISNTSKMLSGIILITVPTIEYGGSFLLGMLRRGEAGYVDNALRHDMFRAGHAHAGVIVLLSLIIQLLADVAILPEALLWIARLGAPCAAILMPLGFFFSAASPSVTQPSRMVGLVYAGAVILGAGVLVLGMGLIRAALRG